MIITNPFAIVAPTADEGDAATRRAPTALSFGPHDPLYGTGVGADIRTWIAQGVHPLAAITRVEARNTQKLQGVLQMPTEAVQRQWEAVRGDTLIDAVKTGLLGDARMTQAVGDLMRAARSEASVGRWVCDPEWIARSGEQRVEQAVMAVSRTHLLPYADVIVVNCYEAELLTERRVGDRGSIRDALMAIYDLGGGAAVIKGPPEERHAIDYVYDGSGVVEFGRDRLRHAPKLGRGAIFSAAITGRLSHGDDVLSAVEQAKEAINAALAVSVRVGEGEQPAHALAPLYTAAGKAINTRDRSEDTTDERGPDEVLPP